MLRICFVLASARALQAPPQQKRAMTPLHAADAALAVDADAFDSFGVAAVAASAKLASHDPEGEKPSDVQSRGVVMAAALGTIAVLAAPKTAHASTAEPTAALVASTIPNKLARQILQIERLNVDSNGSGDRKSHKPRLDVFGTSAKICVDNYEPFEDDRIQYMWLKNEDTDAIVAAKEFPEGFKGTPSLSCSVTPGRNYAPCVYFTTHGLWLGRSEQA